MHFSYAVKLEISFKRLVQVILIMYTATFKRMLNNLQIFTYNKQNLFQHTNWF